MKKTKIDISSLMHCTQAFIVSVQELLDGGHLDIADLEHGLRTALFSDASMILKEFLNQSKVLDSFTSQGAFHEYRTRKVHGLFGVFELRRGYCPVEARNNLPAPPPNR